MFKTGEEEPVGGGTFTNKTKTYGALQKSMNGDGGFVFWVTLNSEM